LRISYRMAACAAAVAVTLAACGEAPEEEGGGTETEASGEQIRACAVLDVGGVDDRSFNQSAWSGMEQANEANPNIEVSYVQSQGDADYLPNLRAQAESCDAVIGVGALLAAPLSEVAPEFPDVSFMIIDAPSSGENVYGATFFTEQSGFLGGYLAASLTETGTVGTYGGINVGRGVTGYMEGFRLGVEYYAEQKGEDVTALGWDGSDGLFAGSFDNPPDGRAATDALTQQGADIVFPVAGGTGTGSFTAAEESGGDVNVIWVDFPGCEFYPEYCQYIPTSVTKAIPEQVQQFLTSVSEGEPMTGDYEGTLENEGTGITGFNEFEDQVSDETKAELEEVEQQIIDGTIDVQPVRDEPE